MHHERRNMNENNSNDLQTIITQVIEEMKSEQRLYKNEAT